MGLLLRPSPAGSAPGAATPKGWDMQKFWDRWSLPLLLLAVAGFVGYMLWRG
ncbi:MAG TPA: hypothetical protein VG406_01285 [Isosphaeraceae bacterium]|jgi:hypothetical protein|nr:hypothetical protein [Isosphaeraceae bacterium]